MGPAAGQLEVLGAGHQHSGGVGHTNSCLGEEHHPGEEDVGVGDIGWGLDEDGQGEVYPGGVGWGAALLCSGSWWIMEESPS